MDNHEQLSWDAYNDLLLYGGIDRFSKLLARYELYKMITDIPGDVVEGGVFKGAGLLYWAKLIEIMNPRTSRKVVGFDTFEGYPEPSRDYESRAAREFEESAGYEPIVVERLAKTIATQNLQGRVELVKGDVTSTVREYVKAHPGFRVALLNLDFDTYDATKAALNTLYGYVVPRGVVVLDEYAVSHWGESDAVDEFIQAHKIELRSLPWTHSPSAYFVKGH